MARLAKPRHTVSGRCFRSLNDMSLTVLVAFLLSGAVSMSYRHILVCDDCGLEVANDPDDGQPDGWGITSEHDDFCPTCAPTLDPYDPEADASLSEDRRAALTRGAMSACPTYDAIASPPSWSAPVAPPPLRGAAPP